MLAVLSENHFSCFRHRFWKIQKLYYYIYFTLLAHEKKLSNERMCVYLPPVCESVYNICDVVFHSHRNLISLL